MAGNHNSGRNSKTQEQEIIEKLSVLDDLFFEKLAIAIEKGEPYAMKLFATHRIPKPQLELEVLRAEQPLFDLKLPTITFVNTDGTLNTDTITLNK